MGVPLNVIQFNWYLVCNSKEVVNYERVWVLRRFEIVYMYSPPCLAEVFSLLCGFCRKRGRMTYPSLAFFPFLIYILFPIKKLIISKWIDLSWVDRDNTMDRRKIPWRRNIFFFLSFLVFLPAWDFKNSKTFWKNINTLGSNKLGKHQWV